LHRNIDGLGVEAAWALIANTNIGMPNNFLIFDALLNMATVSVGAFVADTERTTTVRLDRATGTLTGWLDGRLAGCGTSASW